MRIALAKGWLNESAPLLWIREPGILPAANRYMPPKLVFPRDKAQKTFASLCAKGVTVKGNQAKGGCLFG
jgi:hypothetical protein